MNIAAVGATAEVLATIVNTFEPEILGNKLDPVTARNIRAAAQQEKNHHELLTSDAVGGKAVTKMIHVPDEVFSSPERTAVLAEDREHDQTEGERPREIDERGRLARVVEDGQESPVHHEDREGDREEQEEAVVRLAPEAEEVERDNAGGDDARTGQ